MALDERLSALSCGCDPGAHWVCAAHRDTSFWMDRATDLQLQVDDLIVQLQNVINYTRPERTPIDPEVLNRVLSYLPDCLEPGTTPCGQTDCLNCMTRALLTL